MSIILGIDPGTTTTGFAIIEKKSSKYHIINYGVLSTPAKIELGQKLYEIGKDLQQLIDTYQPDLVSIEKLFFNTNITTGIAVSHARGVVIYECMRAGMSYVEYTPLQVKKSITGNGRASKIQLQNALKMIFSLDQIPKPDDAADAIGLAYMGALHQKILK